ncbi:hypothetical protein AHAS_Ahas12G0093000 [Arachis hypogaea]
MCFIFTLYGWKGIAHDAYAFDNAITTLTINFSHSPPGKYYLVDVDYPTPKEYIGPYKCERYHLTDFRRSSRFTNHNEICILRHIPKFKIETQVLIIYTTMIIDNFIRRHSKRDIEFN